VSEVQEGASGFPFKFPNPADEAYARAQEFRRLTPEERWRQIAELMELGMNMVRNSPRRAEIEQRMEAQEAEWQRIQKEIFSQYGS
jgi:hypothetical protein